MLYNDIKQAIRQFNFEGKYLSAEELRTYLAAVAAGGPQKEGMMTQYWQLDEEPVESMEYWDESERYLREAPERTIERYSDLW